MNRRELHGMAHGALCCNLKGHTIIDRFDLLSKKAGGTGKQKETSTPKKNLPNGSVNYKRIRRVHHIAPYIAFPSFQHHVRR